MSTFNVKLKCDTRFNAVPLKKGSIISVDELIAERWCSRGLAEMVPEDPPEQPVEEKPEVASETAAASETAEKPAEEKPAAKKVVQKKINNLRRKR